MSVSRRPRAALLAVALATALGGFAFAPAPLLAKAPVATVDIPFEQFILPNGLRVVVHTDRKAPIVAVNIWYHVGSKDEPAGRSGFAHLFEHLMFNGSENHPGEFFDPFEKAGATDQNGTTNTDRTNYFQNVPTTALDMALWMESDRMGHLLGAIDQATLDEQRGVVQNEKRQGENQPYGQLWQVMAQTMYPAGHPYHHTVIGSMNDLNAAALADVKTWFRTWYGPNNAVLVLAGDIDMKTAKEKVAKYFGDIPATPTMTQPAADVPVLSASGRTEMEDKVPQVRVQRMWNVPQVTSEESDLLDLFSDVLGGSASSRLDKRLVHEEKLVDSVSTMNYGSQLSGQFGISAMVKQGVDEKKVEAIIDEELQKLLKDGPTAEELQRAKTSYRAGFIRGIERIGGFGGKADTLAACTIYENDPGCSRGALQTIAAATPAQVRAVGATWLGKPSHTFVVKPGARTPLPEQPAQTPAPFVLPPADPKFTASPSGVDRSTGVPKVESFPDLKFPALQRATLKNGSTVLLAERHEVPVVNVGYQFAGGGYSSDVAAKLGIAGFTTSLMGEGAGERGALQFKSATEELGADIDVGASLDGASASLSALKENLAPSLALFSDLLRRPRLEQRDIDRVKAQWLAGIRQEKARPQSLLGRLVPPLVYGEGHPYAKPASGTGTEASIAALGRDDLLNWRREWLRPEGATVIVVGDTTLKEIVPLLDAQFGDWKGEGAAPAIPAPANAALPAKERVFLVDQPGAVQANIIGAQLVPSSRDAGAIVLEIANSVLGGEFSSRLNMNLRENKHWAYGSYSGIGNALAQRRFQASAAVQIDKTAESLNELRKEIRDYAGGARPATGEELARIQATETRGLPGAYETAAAVQGTLAGIVRYGRPDDYVFKRKATIEGLTPDAVNAAARTLKPDAITWVVVGDLSKIEAPIRALNIGEVTVLDADGKPVAKKK